DSDTLLIELNDAHSSVQENAIKLSEPLLNSHPDILNRVAQFADAAEPRLRFQAAFSLGEATGPVAAKALSKLARREDNDAWMQAAILSSVTDVAANLFEDLLMDHDQAESAKKFVTTPSGAAMLGQLARIIGIQHRDRDVRKTIAALEQSSITDQLCDP